MNVATFVILNTFFHMNSALSPRPLTHTNCTREKTQCGLVFQMVGDLTKTYTKKNQKTKQRPKTEPNCGF